MPRCDASTVQNLIITYYNTLERASLLQENFTGLITGRKTSPSPSWAPSRAWRGGRTRTGSRRTTWATPRAETTPASTWRVTMVRELTERMILTLTWRERREKERDEETGQKNSSTYETIINWMFQIWQRWVATEILDKTRKQLSTNAVTKYYRC